MKQTPVSCKFDSAKLKALQYYLEKDNKKIDEELRRYLEELYGKQVPAAAREYVEADNQSNEDKVADQDNKTEKQSRRHSAKQAAAAQQSDAPSGPVLSM